MPLPMDVMITIDYLAPAANYGGSTSANTEAAYDALTWYDERPKPTWAEILAAWVIVEKIMLRDQFKLDREAPVAQIVVTTAAGNAFDGNEASQWRMARALQVLQAQPAGATIDWILHDNTVKPISAAEMLEALTLAVNLQTELWIPPEY